LSEGQAGEAWETSERCKVTSDIGWAPDTAILSGCYLKFREVN
jgi:hypothetical protein